MQKDPRAAVFDALSNTAAGMLGVDDSGQHMQPMTHFADAEAATVCFITSAETDLARAVGQGARAHYCVAAPDDGVYACLRGTLVQSQDSGKLDELWSPAAAAWFKEGRDDPNVMLLQLNLQDAALWAASTSAIATGIEIARANLSTGHQPDLGEHVAVRFDT
ncbi:MAG: pyridoxamine 5'-phosphate oxidase family protein [Paracoccaceae bacterium]